MSRLSQQQRANHGEVKGVFELLQPDGREFVGLFGNWGWLDRSPDRWYNRDVGLDDKGQSMDVAYSVDGVPIRLTVERWFHIVENHDDLAGYYERTGG